MKNKRKDDMDNVIWCCIKYTKSKLIVIEEVRK